MSCWSTPLPVLLSLTERLVPGCIHHCLRWGYGEHFEYADNATLTPGTLALPICWYWRSAAANTAHRLDAGASDMREAFNVLTRHIEAHPTRMPLPGRLVGMYRVATVLGSSTEFAFGQFRMPDWTPYGREGRAPEPPYPKPYRYIGHATGAESPAQAAKRAQLASRLALQATTQSARAAAR